ncbi:glycosyltransferase [Beijerinckia sp. L45]|uniref:glycosyltransferase n=1 Tax=Beijerinckia sp. L45 TaxID=1641855 RepID=UPI00131D5719|nr:hypothetical protein [Beijerinckia sp. L45]
MKILYRSCHQILEYDEIRMLQKLGHTVFPLGAYTYGRPSEAFRPEIDFGWEFYALLEKYKASPSSRDIRYIDREFASNFDVCISMFDFNFLTENEDALHSLPCVLRTIGQSIEAYEPLVAKLKSSGTYIVRYSPAEARAANYAGHDAIIRFPKEVTGNSWLGDADYVLTFSNDFRQRYEADYQFFVAATRDRPTRLAGRGNETCHKWIGLISAEQQQKELRSCRTYFYCTGGYIPYTLNIMEAMLAGAPIVAVRPTSAEPFSEIQDILSQSAIFVESSEEAGEALRYLSENTEAARSLSAKAFHRGKMLFDDRQIGDQWDKLLAGIV